MKGPHFFEKRKKEMARQQKAKEKADRKAQRKTGGVDGAGVEGVDFFLDADGNQVNADGTIVLVASGEDGEETEAEGADDTESAGGGGEAKQSASEHAKPAAGALRGTQGG